ncbi:MAG: glycosyltransferase family 4 protein [Firmicutes bacterium]|nr:glycosyltransferase family 4 protein [Bacillota bacterium]
MKVAMLHWAFPPVIGGVETHLVLLGPELVKRGWQVDLLTGTCGGKREEFYWEGMRVRRTPLMDLNSLSPASIQARRQEIAEEITSFLEQSSPDLIHAHNMHYFSPVHAQILGEFKVHAGVPLLLTAHNVWEDRLWEEMLWCAGQWDGIIAVSSYIKKELAASGYPEDRITVVHHGIDLNRFPPADSEAQERAREKFPQLKGKRVIFHPARMSFAKGSHLAVQALKEVKKAFPEVLLVLAGTEQTVDWDRVRDREVAQIMALVEKLELAGHVFVRFFSWEEMPAMYQAADVCIYPSCFEEPFGIALLEAMASGRPVVASKAGGMPEIIEDGKSGLLIEKGSHRELAERLIALLEDQKLARTLVENGLERVRTAFTREIMVERTRAVYEQAAAGRISLAETAATKNH